MLLGTVIQIIYLDSEYNCNDNKKLNNNDKKVLFKYHIKKILYKNEMMQIADNT